MAMPVIGQTLGLDNDSQTLVSLTGTTVTLTGRSELRITGTSNPLAGCVVQLNSPDSWFFMTNILPSVVNSTYLSQVRVSGAVAVADSNCRVVQYGDGTVIIPHASTFTPMQVFTGSHFTGNSTTLTNFTAYNDSSLGIYANAISSFKLKRGYTATIAQNANGTGISKNYVAQDGDIEVSVLPDELNDSISFIRIFPWRWVNKKGIAGNIASGLNVRWDYNWNLDRNSTADVEYVPIRQQRWWPDLNQDWKTRGANHLLGYNEPDNTAQANLAVGDAIWSWPDLLATGLRLGSPAATDGGRTSWLYPFMTQADAAGLRVDFVAVHYYWCYNPSDPTGAATQMYNYLKAVYDQTHRPIWVTEWNNGANWTGCGDPDYVQQAAAISAIIRMLDTTPFVERYAAYNWVEDVRRLKWDDGSLTTAGVVYRDQVSPLAYSQVIPEVPTDPNALYQFENDSRDSSAFGHSAVLKGGAKFGAGKNLRGVVLSGNSTSADHVQLSSKIGDSTDFTFGAWIYWNGGSSWQRVFDLGNGTNKFMFLTPAAGDSGNLRFAIKNGGGEQQLNHSASVPIKTWTHVAVTISGNTGKLFVNGALVNTNAGMTINPIDLATSDNFLGRSQFAADPFFSGTLDEVQFLPYALSDANVVSMQTNKVPQFTNASIVGAAGTQNVAYSGTISGAATDSGDSITYTKAQGPAWLTVSASGALSGTPTFADDGLQSFIIYATDSVGVAVRALLTIQLPSITGNGSWLADSDGIWNDVTKWSSSTPANGVGYTANFSALNITTDRMVTLDASRSIGALQFGDTLGSQSWTLAANSGKTLTLATSTGGPTITVNQNSATLSAALAGTAGFTKNGPGRLVLAGNNPISGTLNIDTSSTTVSEGSVRLACPGSAAALSLIQIRSNNSGSSTLELDGGLGSVAATAPISVSGRNSATIPAVLNVTGNNTLSGLVSIQPGGANYNIQSDAGTLTLGSITSGTATNSRAMTFLGGGNIAVSGNITNGAANLGLALTKNGTGTCSLLGQSTFTGNLTINGGVLSLVNGGAIFAGGWNNTAVITINSNGTLELDRWGYGATNANFRAQSFGGLDYNPARLVLNGGTIRYSGGAAGAPQDPAEAPYGPGFTIGASGASLEAAKVGDTWTVKYDSRGFGPITSTSGGTLNLTGSGDGIFDKELSGAGGLVKAGSGNWTLSRANTYSGPTTIRGGGLVVSGSIGTGALSVENGATLSGSGRVGGNLTIQAGGGISAGSGIGTLTASGSVALLAGSTTLMEINKSTGGKDLLSVGGILNLGGTLKVTNLAGNVGLGDSFQLFQGGTIVGSFAAVDLPVLSTGLEWDTQSISLGKLSVKVSLSAYQSWAVGYAWPTGKDGGGVDADGDGVANAFEWIFGSNPLVQDPSCLPQPVVRAVTVAEYPSAVVGQSYLTMTATIRKNHAGMTLVAQANSRLDALDSVTSEALVSSILVQDLGEFEKRTWIYTKSIQSSEGGHGFMRLKLISE